MKRRNAESGKLRRPLKRTKITEGMYGNSLLYFKFVMLWATVVFADYMLEFRFEFLWPFWMMLRSVYDSFKYQGLAFSVFFICIALTSDMICFFFIPLQYIFFAASTYVWVQYVWYSFTDKGICLPTVVVCCFLLYVESTVRGRGADLARPLAAHCVGYPVVTLGFGVKTYVGQRLKLRRQRQVREENEFYFQLMKDALPESALEENQPSKEGVPNGPTECAAHPNGTSTAHAAQAHAPQTQPTDARHLNGSLRRRKEPNGCTDPAGHSKLDKLEKAANGKAHALSNGVAHTEEHHENSKGGAKSSKCDKKEASTLKEEKRKSKTKDKDSSDSHKSTEQIKEQIVKEKEVESTKDVKISNKECSAQRDKEKALEKEREKETREREKERERERERERELREAREYAEEIKRLKAELAASRNAEAEARRALAAAAAADRQRRADHSQLKQAHQALQHKMSTWRSGDRATLERRLGEERRARTAAEHQLQRAKQRAPPAPPAPPAMPAMPSNGTASSNSSQNGACDSEWCRAALRCGAAEAQVLRRELARAREQTRALEARSPVPATPPPAPTPSEGGARLAAACAALTERAQHLQRALSAETRVKLDLLQALGDAKRHMHIQEGLISRQEKEMEELKAQMLAVMPAEYVTSSGGVSKLRLGDASPLDPNASVYTPKQLCSDA